MSSFGRIEYFDVELVELLKAIEHQERFSQAFHYLGMTGLFSGCFTIRRAGGKITHLLVFVEQTQRQNRCRHRLA